MSGKIAEITEERHHMSDYAVVVLGTGAAGLTAAELGDRVGLFDKGHTFGGATVYCGGTIWLPHNQREPAEKGDTREYLSYVKALSNKTITRRVKASAGTEALPRPLIRRRRSLMPDQPGHIQRHDPRKVSSQWN
jgi:succinate dehydrogenase/fumarate reductase flavoprotein subunit